MAIFPRPATPRAALGDLWAYLKTRRAHKWPLMGLSAAITYLIICAFINEGNTNTMPRRNRIFYVQNWSADRSDVAIIMQQKLDLAQAEKQLGDKQKSMQKLADTFGIEWREDEARNSARRAQAIRRINAELDARLAKALATGQHAAPVLAVATASSGR